MSMEQKLKVGLELPMVTDLMVSMTEAVLQGFRFLVINLSHPKFLVDQILLSNSINKIPKDDDFRSLILGKLSPWLQLDSPHTSSRETSEVILARELELAAYFELAVVIIRLKKRKEPNLAHLVHRELLDKKFNKKIWCHVPMMSPFNILKEKDDPWHWWSTFQQYCDGSPKLGLVLEVTRELPSNDEIERWFGEPIKMVVFPTTLFEPDSNGLPMLPNAHRIFLAECAKRLIAPCLTGPCIHGTLARYEHYIETFYTANETRYSADASHLPMLQTIRQPLKKLSFFDYNLYEKDYVKYTTYENALCSAFQDRMKNNDPSKLIVVLVAGAGRGPLVSTAYTAGRKVNANLKIYAIETNPFVLQNLHDMNSTIWRNVEIIHCDVENWDAPEKCDILLTELFGSFGDNEISPEYLEKAHKHLKDDGIAIPSEYTSFIAPVQSLELFHEATKMCSHDEDFVSKFETPYIANAYNHMFIISKPASVFICKHSNDEEGNHNKSRMLNFKVSIDSNLHGFGVYFKTILYKDFKLDTVPKLTGDLFTEWPPLFFPIRKQIALTKDDNLEVHFKRIANKTCVWYEWSVTSPVILSPHNMNGKYFKMKTI